MDNNDLKNQLQKWVESQQNTNDIFSVSNTKFDLSGDKQEANCSGNNPSLDDWIVGVIAAAIFIILLGIIIGIGIGIGIGRKIWKRRRKEYDDLEASQRG